MFFIIVFIILNKYIFNIHSDFFIRATFPAKLSVFLMTVSISIFETILNCFLLEEGKDPDLYPVHLQMQYGVSIIVEYYLLWNITHV
ncbi:hypothetical protein EO98_04870 [Methanosarcina sp. 2.H.T.1A.6]|nr:hypothetical protein EO97_16015 [Methanosarcina sp. 2.H.T.1A.15]KKG15395.1 hypothetical protein EO94_00025 [Methanosarcina sp. 2.H.T.1A.3]KKG24744.1 hypothetical protein EO98_04870 [Methanosarcina sp. 2.H.T.1A.6]KKG26139.1 hypothetical protein EO96_16725 [Methanosarcina sp. 2.H.T.1A.8]